MDNTRVFNGNRFHKSVANTGFIGEGHFKVSINRKKTKEYTVWSHMITRCYSENQQIISPTYVGCTVDERWHNFQVFAEWYLENYIENYFLDKDILVKGNKIYGPETCCFVPREINNLFKKYNKESNLPPGITIKNNQYQAQISDAGFKKNLGLYFSIGEAFEKYKEQKEKIIKETAEKYINEIPDIVYKSMYNYKIEITD